MQKVVQGAQSNQNKKGINNKNNLNINGITQKSSILKKQSRDLANQMVQKITKIKLLKYISLCLLFFVFAKCRILGAVSPCFYGIFLTLLFLGENPLYLSLSYLASVILCGATISSFGFSVGLCVVGSVIALIHKLKSKTMPTYLMVLCCFFLGLCNVCLNTSTISNFYVSLTNIILNSLSLLCCSNFLKILKTRKFNLNLNVDEVVCGCVILGLLFCGFQNLNFFIFDIVKLLGFCLILFSNLVLPSLFSIVLAIVSGFGVGLCGANLSYITLFGVVAIFCYIFKNHAKIYTVLSVLIVDLSLSLFFNISNTPIYFSIMPTLIACIAFICLPNSLIEKIKQTTYISNKSSSLKNILNQNKLQVSKKLAYTAEVFYEMDKSFRNLVKGSLDPKSAKLMVCQEVIKHNCECCPQKAKCLKGFNTELKKVFERLSDVGFEKGKITLVDLPAYLTNRCVRVSNIVSSFNNLLSEYKNYTSMLNNLDASKLLIADQLGGISHILNNLSDSTKQTVSQDHKLEKIIKETLIYNDIVPSEVVCFEKDYATNVVAMIVRNIDFDNDKIVKILNKICPSKMMLDEVFNQNTCLTYLSYKTAPTYDISVGIAQTSKGGEDVCGDSHSISKLADDKFMFAICDGMGHGKEANKQSELSISLIENFYKAGFDNQTILTSVNSLLNLDKRDMFSALDVSVVDLKSGEVDFIKQGATIGFVKNSNQIAKIESNSLPIGVLDKISPKVTKTVLTTDDTVIMLSDGIVDAFGEEEALQDYLMSLPNKNPQDLAETILNRAKSRQKNYPKDDMTVLVGKLFYNCA